MDRNIGRARGEVVRMRSGCGHISVRKGVFGQAEVTREEPLMPTAPSWRFDPFRLDPVAPSLWRDEQLMALPPKPLAVLAYLVAHAGQVVTKDALLEAVWPDTVVTEGVLKTALGQIRQVLGERAKTPHYIATVYRRGYRFIAPVTAAAPPPVPAHTPAPGAPSAAGAPGLVVGREGELTCLQQRWTQAREGARQLVFITGEAGIGKTTLVDAFVAQLATPATAGVWLSRGQCIEQYGAGEAYLPLLEALGRLGREPTGAALVEILRQQAPSWLVQLPALLPGEELEALQRRVSGTTPARMLRELAEAVETLAAERPLVLVLEDLHWSDVSTIEWLAYVARRREPARLLVLATYRPVDAIVRAHPVHPVTQELQRHGQCAELVLGYLPAAGVATYLAQRFGGGEVPVGLADVLHRRTYGNPLFLVAMVDDLVRQDLVHTDRAGWTLPGGLAAVARGVPESLRQLLEQQLVQLPPEDQALLETASVMGPEGSAATIAAGLAAPVDVVESRCAALARRGQFIQPHGMDEWPDGTVATRYRFIHDLYQEILYARVPVGQRAQWHRQIGARLEAGYGLHARELAAELAVHFVRGRDVARAVRYLQDAGENALRRSAYQAAIAHLHQGLALLPTLPETPARSQQELALQLTLGAVFVGLKSAAAPEVARAYSRAWELCQQVGDTPQRVPVLLGLSTSSTVQGQFHTARELAEQALHLAQQAQDAGPLAQAHMVLGNARFFLGELAAARAHLEQCLARYDPQQHHLQSLLLAGEDLQVFCLARLANLLWYLGYPDQALQRGHEALTLARERSSPYSLAVALTFVAGLHQRRREGHRAHELVEAAVALAHEQGFAYRLAQADSLRGWALVAQGQGEAGIRLIRQGLTAERATGAATGQPYRLALLADAYGQVGQPEAGLQVLAEALTRVDNPGGRPWVAELLRLQGEFLLARGADQHAAAETCFRQALDIAHRRQAKSLELRAAMRLSRLWQGQRKRKQAHQLLAPIYTWFTEGFDTADLQEAKTLLEALS
jgi:predicted ATPase/DNA-binding winged helix-turn-helix (wHTH) protein